MSCRHDLALNTCRICYPRTGAIDPGPGPHAPSLDGPGARPADPVDELISRAASQLCAEPADLSEALAQAERQLDTMRAALESVRDDMEHDQVLREMLSEPDTGPCGSTAARVYAALAEDDDEDGSPCPRCSQWVPGTHELGVMRHEACGYCRHPSRDDGVCGLCGDGGGDAGRR